MPDFRPQAKSINEAEPASIDLCAWLVMLPLWNFRLGLSLDLEIARGNGCLKYWNQSETYCVWSATRVVRRIP